MNRLCVECFRRLPRTCFTSVQYAKGEGVSRCTTCVHGNHFNVTGLILSDSGRYNDSSEATIEGDGTGQLPPTEFRCMATGLYTEGDRKGQRCVVKWFKAGSIFEQDYFSLDTKAIYKALKIVNLFNQLNISSKPITVNVPGVWIFDIKHDSGEGSEGRLATIEPFIEDCRKFNSNSGWSETTEWAKVMQALSHFSFHITGGTHVICDLQGGIYKNAVILSNPVILSRTREYGVTDLGMHGISSFFAHHKCSNYCQQEWYVPVGPIPYFELRSGTTMLQYTPTIHTPIISRHVSQLQAAESEQSPKPKPNRERNPRDETGPQEVNKTWHTSEFGRIHLSPNEVFLQVALGNESKKVDHKENHEEKHKVKHEVTLDQNHEETSPEEKHAEKHQKKHEVKLAESDQEKHEEKPNEKHVEQRGENHMVEHSEGHHEGEHEDDLEEGGDGDMGRKWQKAWDPWVKQLKMDVICPRWG
ncbi:kinase-like domain-containing protein [Cercophora newfieldiana]|uniref:Kinase-like domain-containing protein n=1 Tax=Cercophora newfieldiana TaxID=92897 RepID=A0AA39Y8E1_9PEZI|nr:kinase-like domain-containing protein [Cercophora newfieldiana]